jgi:transposase-like protein
MAMTRGAVHGLEATGGGGGVKGEGSTEIRYAVRTLDRIARRLGVAKSHVVREALHEYGERVGRLTEREREAKLAIFDRVIPTLPERPREQVERELEQVREARRRGGRRAPGA